MYNVESFSVQSLFANVPLDKTLEIKQIHSSDSTTIHDMNEPEI